MQVMNETNRKVMSSLEELRHSAAHVMAAAVLRLFPEVKLDIGPPTATGFYYDFDLEHRFTQEDLEKIEEEMKKIVKENQRFERKEVTREEAQTFFNEAGQDYKLSRLEDIPEGDAVTFYQNGEFVDLCAGTHVSYTKQIKAFKLLSIAGAYYRGDEKNKQLQRIYGTAFPSKDELKDYLERLEEAKKRDHRKIGKAMKLFLIDDKSGAGLPLWLPNGAILRRELQAFISNQLREQGYEEVFTPHIGKLDLFRTSGHFPYYKESQFPPIVERDQLHDMVEAGQGVAELEPKLEDGDLDGFLLRPMNCPFHVKIYDSEPRSYRDLPLRYAEFGSVYRWEQSGELNGLTRVRGFTQDDAHIFCLEDQIEQEVQGCLNLVKIIFKTLGMENFRVRVGLRDPDSTKYIGDSASWDRAEDALRKTVQTLGVPYNEEAGEAAFYGPKIDFVVKDVLNRDWQLGTIQLDYNLPNRFDLTYVGADNKEHRPVMIHRAPFGSFERFTGVLIEHFGGDFPTWLAPEQVRILPINDAVRSFAEEVKKTLFKQGVRVKVDAHQEKLGAMIRRAESAKVPHMLVIGEKEAAEGKVTLRSRANPSWENTYTVDAFAQQLLASIEACELPESFGR